MPADVFRYVGTESAWHRSGIVTGRTMRGIEVVEIGELDYQVSTTGAFFRTIDGTELPIDDTVAIYRGPTTTDPVIRSFGAAGKNWTPIQNRTLGEIIDPMTEHWPIVTAGALGVGELVWFLLEIGDVEIARELHKRYVVVSNAHKPGQSLIVKPVDERVVCRNTHQMAMKEASVTISLRHTLDIETNTRHVFKAMEELRRLTQLDIANLQALADWAAQQGDEEEAVRKAIVESAFPEPPRPRVLTGQPTAKHELRMRQYGQTLELMKEYRIAAYEETDRIYDEFPAIARTPYGVYQAVIASVDHRRDTSANARSALWGSGARTKERAFVAALDVIGR